MARPATDARPPEGAAPYLARLIELIAADRRPVGEIATAAGMSEGNFYQIRTGRRGDLSSRTLARILAALGRTWADLDAPPTPIRTRKPKAKARP